jgi:hypothetical protein
MRRRILALLVSLELAVFCAIVACSFQLSREVVRSRPAATLAHAVVRTSRRVGAVVRKTQQIALRLESITLD